MDTENDGLPSWITRRIMRCRFMLDANCINARQANDDLNALERWAADGVIHVGMSQPSAWEAAAAGPLWASKAFEHVNTITYASTDDREVFDKITAILFPEGANSPNQKNDVELVFSAKKYSRILVTTDGDSKRQPGGILGNAPRLREEIGVTVMRPSEAVVFTTNEIQRRDELATRACESMDLQVPWWLGKD